MRHRKAAIWFQWSSSPWNRNPAMTVNTVKDMTSCITFSCISVKGPPFPVKPALLAGTMRQYSKKAMHHEKAMTPMRGHDVEIFICWSFRWPYQASVIKTLLPKSSSIV